MKPSDRCSTIFVKILVILLGLLALSLLFVIEKLGGVLVVSVQILCRRSIIIYLKILKRYRNYDLGDE